MKKHFLKLLFLLLLPLESFSQNAISIEKIIVKDFGSEIPHAVGENSALIAKVNDLILDHLMIDSFDQKEIFDFPWYDLSFNYEIKSDVLCIDYDGEYAGGPYPNYVDHQLIIDLKTGNELKKKEIPLSAFFTLEGYYEFLDNHWMEGVKIAFQDALECSEGNEPYCSVYDIEYRRSSEGLVIDLIGDCFPRVMMACSPSYSTVISVESLKPFLNEFGVQALVEDNYVAMSPLDQFLYHRDHKEDIPAFAFITGKVDAKYPFRMAFQIDSMANTVEGYYYYEKNKVKIDLDGSIEGSKMLITETVDGKVTGHFEFLLFDSYENNGFYLEDGKYFSGFWLKPDKYHSYQVEFESVDL